MTDRTVVYRLRAEASQFKAQMASVAATTRKTGVEMGTSMKAGASSAIDALDDLGINAKTTTIALGAGAILAGANFEKAMSSVQAATHETEAGMDALREAALEAGATTSFSATEAAAGIENLAKAGLSTQDILDGGLDGALDLAAAGSMDVADAAEAAAGAMAQFKLEGDQATHVADLLAAGAGKAQGDVSDMVMALKQAGTVSAQTGLSLEETVGALSAMAEQSLLGSDAGTSFKTMLAALTPNSAKAAKAMEQYNIHAFDAQGNFVGMTELAGQLQAGLSGLTDEQRAMALETIFGSDAVRAASIIYDNGAEGIANWTAQVDDAGYAAETAAIQLDNLKGDVEALKGALETAFIEGGDESQGMLRGITQLATDTVNLTTEAEKADGVLGGLWNSAMNAVNPLGSLSNAYNGLKGEISGTEEKSKDLDTTSKSLTSTSSAAAGGLDAQANSADGLAMSLEDAEAAAGAFEDLIDSLNAALGGRAEMRDYEAAIDDFTKSLKDNGKTFDINTNKGRENQAMLDGIASSAIAVADEMGQADRRKFLTQAISDLKTMGDRLGVPKSEIKALIELLRQANKADVKPKVEADTSRAMQSFREVDQYLSNLNGRRAVTYVDTVRTVTGPRGAAAFSQNALGDLKDRHNPQIAPGGSWRVWAEPETMGESYIPHANDHRRPRAKRILEDTASMFGGEVYWFASGGSTKPKRKSGGRPDGAFEPPRGNSDGELLASVMQSAFQSAIAQAEAAQAQADAADVAFLAAQDQLEAAMTSAQAAEESLRAAEQQRDNLNASVASQFSGGLTGGGLSGLMQTLGRDINAGSSMDQTLRALVDAGLDTEGVTGGLFRELAASEDQRTANELLAAGPAMIAMLEQQYAQREAVNAQRGTFVSEASFGPLVAQHQAANVLAQAQLDQAQAAATAAEARAANMANQVAALQDQVGNLAGQLADALNSVVKPGRR